jgi:RNA polymerase sigma-70 factor (ECF subfamily)
MQSDEELMSATARGEMTAFEMLARRHQTSAWNIAFRLLGNADEAEDVAQEAFLRILQAAPRYQPTAAFRTYLYRIVTRLCHDHRRKTAPFDGRDPDAETSPEPSPDEIAVADEQCHAVRQALDALPLQQRTAVILRYYESLRYDEIADVLGTSRKGVERLLARGKAALAARLRRFLGK